MNPPVQKVKRKSLRNAKRRRILNMLFQVGAITYLVYDFLTRPGSIIHFLIPIGIFVGIGMFVFC